MELWINGEGPKQKWTITDTDYQLYSWHGVIPSNGTVDIVFTNDNASGGVDTNLYIDYISVNDNIIQSESASVTLDRGSYSAGCFDGISQIAGWEAVSWTGALRFPMSSAIVS